MKVFLSSFKDQVGPWIYIIGVASFLTLICGIYTYYVLALEFIKWAAKVSGYYQEIKLVKEPVTYTIRELKKMAQGRIKNYGRMTKVQLQVALGV